MKESEPFWKRKKISELNNKEWESLCDKCGKCCLFKIEDEKSGEVFFTNVVCRLFDKKKCLCGDYKNRKKLVHSCRILNPKTVYKVSWLPMSCAYRLVSEGRDLEDWHPLISGNEKTVHSSGNSLKGKFIISEQSVDDLRKHIVTWVD